jgi:hypothetical protein
MENFFTTNLTKDKKISTMTIYISIVVILIIVVYILYLFLKPNANQVTAMGPWNLSGAEASVTQKQNSTITIFNNSQIESSLGNNFTLGFFIYMSDVGRENVSMGGPEGDFRFKPFAYILGVGDVLIDPIHQIVYVRVKPLDKNGLIDRGGIVSVAVKNFMVARWNQLVITLEGRSLDVYLNGALATSTLLENIPTVKPVGVLMDKSPDFGGQSGLWQAWPRRLTESEISRNYLRNTDTRGKPLIPDKAPSILEIFKDMGKGLCDIGFCGFRFRVSPLEYVDYDFA